MSDSAFVGNTATAASAPAQRSGEQLSAEKTTSVDSDASLIQLGMATTTTEDHFGEQGARSPATESNGEPKLGNVFNANTTAVHDRCCRCDQ